MNSWVVKPTELPDHEIVALTTLVLSGGAIPKNTDFEVLKERLLLSSSLAVYKEDVHVLGVASLKVPDPDYRMKVFRKACMSHEHFQYAPELGYISVHPEKRRKGIADKLVHALIGNLKEPCYATTDSEPMKRILGKAGFSEAGKTWKGKRGVLSLWIKD